MGQVLEGPPAAGDALQMPEEVDPPFWVSWFRVAGGGFVSSSDDFVVEGTVGQHEVGGRSVSVLMDVAGGYWVMDEDVKEAKDDNLDEATSLHSRQGTGNAPILDFELPPISPNPSRGVARIAWAVPRESDVRLTIHDVQGRRMASLAEGIFSPGRYVREWRPAERSGSGIFFARLETPAGVFVRRLVLIER